MKILSIQILASGTPAIPLVIQKDTSSFNFFQARSVAEFLDFFSKTVAERTSAGQRQAIDEAEYTAYAYTRVAPDSLTGVIITDKDYPYRVAFSLLNKILDEYTTAVPRTTWGPAADSLRSGSLAKAPPSVDFPPLAGYLVKYQDPKQADTIMKVQQELDETKVELGRTIESILQRGEKLDSLVEKSNQLSYSSKAFYKTSKQQNSCCGMS